VPTSRAAVSATLNIQVPFEALPLSADKGDSGLKLPANGATPADIAVAAASLKTVGVPEQSFAPDP
jgi:hypothetical protein